MLGNPHTLIVFLAMLASGGCLVTRQVSKPMTDVDMASVNGILANREIVVEYNVPGPPAKSVSVDVQRFTGKTDGKSLTFTPSGQNRSQSIPLQQVRRVRTRNRALGALEGLLVGALVGGIIGGLSDQSNHNDQPCSGDECWRTTFHMDLGLPVGAFLGGIGGLFVGYVIGHDTCFRF